MIWLVSDSVIENGSAVTIPVERGLKVLALDLKLAW